MATEEFKYLMREFKRLLKSQGLTYSDLSERSGIPVSTVKKTLSGRDASFGKLWRLCEAAGITLLDLATVAARYGIRSYCLTLEQESVLAEDPRLLMIFRILETKEKPSAVRTRCGLSVAAFTLVLKKLEKAGLIERMSGDQVRLLTPGNHIEWRTDGPIFKRYAGRQVLALVDHVINSRLPNENYRYATLQKLSRESYQELLTRISLLHREFLDRSRVESVMTPHSELTPVTWLMAGLPISTPAWEDLRR